MKLNNFIQKIRELEISDNSISIQVDYDKEISDVTLKDNFVHIETVKSGLKTLNDHEKENAEIHNILNSIYGAKPNGIECPLCSSELFDTEPGVIYFTNPPKTKVGCSSCHYSGTRTC